MQHLTLSDGLVDEMHQLQAVFCKDVKITLTDILLTN